MRVMAIEIQLATDNRCDLKIKYPARLLKRFEFWNSKRESVIIQREHISSLICDVTKTNCKQCGLKKWLVGIKFSVINELYKKWSMMFSIVSGDVIKFGG